MSLALEKNYSDFLYSYQILSLRFNSTYSKYRQCTGLLKITKKGINYRL